MIFIRDCDIMRKKSIADGRREKMDKIRVGVLGPGRIVRRVMKDFRKAQGVELIAVASRSEERAQSAAREYGAKYAFSSYEALAECAEVDLVYIATPHVFHCGQAIMMMEHGKHVIVEKPMAVTEEQARRMAECAKKNKVFLMEAMWTRFFPAWKKMMELIRAGEIGSVNHVYGVFSCSVGRIDPESRLFAPSLAGGALLDVGVYPLMAATAILGWEPEKAQSLYALTETGVDGRMSVQLQYAGGATAQMMTALDAEGSSDLIIYGTKGYIRMEEFWHPAAFAVIKGGEREEFRFDAENEGFHHEFEEAASCIRKGLREAEQMPLAESIAVCGLTERLRHEAGVYYPGEEKANERSI